MSNSPASQIGTRPTPTIEDYLAIIYVMERDDGEVIPARLAESLEVAPPTVTVTLRRMERDGWVSLGEGKKLRLTDEGCQAARSVIRRHMLTEWMLSRMLKVPWSRVHSEADQMEHTISEATELQMRTNLNDPQLCPHGNPLPGYEHVAAAWFPLVEASPGDELIIRRIHEAAEQNTPLLEFLEANQVVPGKQATLTEILGFNQTLGLQIGKRKVALGFQAARFIYVEKAAG